MKKSIALVGCGGVSPMHLEGCARHSERVEVVALCDPEATRRTAMQEQFGITQGFDSLEAMIGGANWETAIVCTPTHLREPIISQLAKAGKHVLVEKPFASSLEEGQRMIEMCESHGVQIAVDQNFRFHFPFHIAKNLIAEGFLGQISALHHQHLCFRQDNGWRTRETRHVTEIMGVHWLDGLRWITNDEAQSVTAQMRHSNAIDCAGETEVSVQIAFQNGAMATYTDSFSSLVPRCETLILGERGTLRLDYEGATFWERDSASQPTQFWPNAFAGNGKPDSAFECLDELLRAVETGGAPQNGGRDNLKTLALMEAAYQSAQSGATVALQNGELR